MRENGKRRHTIVLECDDMGGDQINALFKAVLALGATPVSHYDIVDAEWYGRMGFCGCGVPVAVQSWLANVLKNLEKGDWKSLERAIHASVETHDAATYFTLYVLKAMGITEERGHSVASSRLTDKGKEFLALLSWSERS